LFILEIDSDVATLIHQHFVSARSKIDLLIRLNSLLIKDQDARDTIRSLLDQAIELNTMRNAYVHSSWATSAEHPDELQRIRQALPNVNARNPQAAAVVIASLSPSSATP